MFIHVKDFRKKHLASSEPKEQKAKNILFQYF